jgi:hypothetical protein
VFSFYNVILFVIGIGMLVWVTVKKKSEGFINLSTRAIRPRRRQVATRGECPLSSIPLR